MNPMQSLKTDPHLWTLLGAGPGHAGEHPAWPLLWPMDGAGCMVASVPGPRTPDGLDRSRKANMKHGFYTAEMIAERRFVRELLTESRRMIREVSSNFD